MPSGVNWWTSYNLNSWIAFIPPAYRSRWVLLLLEREFQAIIAMLWLTEMMGVISTACWIDDLMSLRGQP